MTGVRRMLLTMPLFYQMMNSSIDLTFGSFIWLGSNGSFRDETITSSQIGRQFPAQALSNPLGYGLLSPLMMALNHVLSVWGSVIALCLLSWGRHLTYLSVILSSQRGRDQCVACCCSPTAASSAAAHSGLMWFTAVAAPASWLDWQIYLICSCTHYWD